MKKILFLLLILIEVAKGFENKMIKANLNNIHPTQTDVGKAHVDFSIAKINRVANEKKISLIEAVGSRVLPAWIAPDGSYFITDGHHWASGGLKVATQFSNGDSDVFNKFYYSLNILADYSGKNWDDFYVSIYSAGKGYFRPDIRKEYESIDEKGNTVITNEDLVRMYKESLPKNLADLKNNSWRSVFGIALEEMGFDPPVEMIDYVEFYLWELFSEGLKKMHPGLIDIDNGAFATDKQMQEVKDQIASSDKINAYLYNSARRSDVNPTIEPIENQTRILKVIETHRNRLKLPPFEIPKTVGLRSQCSSHYYFRR